MIHKREIMLQIRSAARSDYETVKEFYYSLIDAMADAAYKPGWERDVYPTQAFLQESIANGELYIGEWEGRMVSCMVVNHKYNDGYKKIRWLVEAKDEELLVIHALGVHPDFSGRGIAKEMVRNTIALAKEGRIRTIRLDVLGGNLPAEKAYTGLGFQYLDTIRMFYEDTGWTEFKIYEYIV